MNRAEFLRGMNDFIEAYGEKRYPDGLMTKLYSAVQVIDGDYFAKAMDELFMQTKGAPTAGEIRASCAAEIQRCREIKRRERIAAFEKDTEKCRLCGLSGWLFAWDRESEGDRKREYAFRCPECQAAKVRNIHHSVPQWDDVKHSRRFELHIDVAKPRASKERVDAVLGAINQQFKIDHRELNPDGP